MAAPFGPGVVQAVVADPLAEAEQRVPLLASCRSARAARATSGAACPSVRCRRRSIVPGLGVERRRPCPPSFARGSSGELPIADLVLLLGVEGVAVDLRLPVRLADGSDQRQAADGVGLVEELLVRQRPQVEVVPPLGLILAAVPLRGSCASSQRACSSSVRSARSSGRRRPARRPAPRHVPPTRTAPAASRSSPAPAAGPATPIALGDLVAALPPASRAAPGWSGSRPRCRAGSPRGWRRRAAPRSPGLEPLLVGEDARPGVLELGRALEAGRAAPAS